MSDDDRVTGLAERSDSGPATAIGGRKGWSIVGSIRRAVSVGPVARNVAVVAGGTAVGQLIVISVSPIISRLYTPSDLGILAVYSSVVAVSLPVALLRYDVAVQLPRSSAQAARLLLAAIGIAVASSSLLAVALWAWRGPFTSLLRVPQLLPYLLLIPLGVLGASLYLALAAWALRARRFRDLARTRITQQVGLCATQVGLGLLHFGPIALLLGDVIGRAGGVGTLSKAASDHDLTSFRGASFQRVIVTARRYSNFALVSSAAGLLNTIGLFGPPLLLASLFGPAVSGQIALAQRVVALPLTLAGQSVAQVYLGELARLARDMPRAVLALLKSTVRRLVLVAIVPSAVLMVGGPWLFAGVFGEQWRLAGTFARILAFAFAAQMVAAPISQTLNVLGRARLQLIWDFGRSTLVLGGIWLVWRAGSPPIGAVVAYSAAMLIAYGFMLGMAVNAARRAGAAVIGMSPQSRE